MFSKSTHERTLIFQLFPISLLFSKPQLFHTLYLIISSNLWDKFYRAWHSTRKWERLALFWSFEGVQSKVDLVLIEQNLSRNFPRFILKEGFTFKSSFLMKRMEWWQKCYFSRNHQSIVESTEIWQFRIHRYLDSNLNQHWCSKNLGSFNDSMVLHHIETGQQVHLLYRYTILLITSSISENRVVSQRFEERN